MERRSLLSRSTSSLSSLLLLEEKQVLPRPSSHHKPRIHVRTLLGHCLYRRVILWAATALFLVCIIVAPSGIRLQREKLWDLMPSKEVVQDTTTKDGPTVVFVVAPGSEKVQTPTSWGSNVPGWLRFRHLDGFFIGLKALVPVRDYRPEHPRPAGEESPFPLTLTYSSMPTPTPFVPQPDYESSDYTSQYHEVQPCYLDKDNKIPVPNTYAYEGAIQGQPEPVIGSHSLLGLKDDVCFDRFGRYGPYGLGYGFDEGGVQVGVDTERAGSEAVWAKTGKINYDTVDWGDAQVRCVESNKKRFLEAEEIDSTPKESSGRSSFLHSERQKIARTAVVVRAYTGFQWTQHAVLNFRAMISELALRSGGEYTVHFLLHVRNDYEAIWADPVTAQRVLDDNVPPEFHSLCVLWSEAQMRLFYPGQFGRSFQNPSSGDIHGVYRSAHMPLQHFALSHPEYAHFWNWEMDVRYLGNYYELFDRLGKWGQNQSRVEAWERSAKYYIPRFHGDWDNFTSLVHRETEASGRPAVLGPLPFLGRMPLRAEQRGESFLPPSCSSSTNNNNNYPADSNGPDSSSPSSPPSSSKCGVGEDADLITLNPLFDAEDSGWVFAGDVTGYNLNLPPPPRRCAIVTASRLSRRLLAVMHEENWRLRHTMFSEMFPATAALHHGLKAVYAPHPVHVDREWDLAAVDAAFNGGRDHTSGGRGSPFDLRNEHNHKGTSWYYHSEFAGLLWRRWLGYAQPDGRGPNGGRSGEGQVRGGLEEERKVESTGRLCLRSMLVHPIKWEHPSELE